MAGVLATPSFAEEDRFRKWSISLGGYFPEYSTSLALIPNVGNLPAVGTSLESVLGLDRQVRMGRLDMDYRLTKRDRIGLSLFGARRVSTLALREDVTIGNTTFPQGAGVRTTLSEDQAQLRYAHRFAVVRKLDVEWTFGIHVTRFRTNIQTTGGTQLAEDASVTAPLPLIGLGLTYDLSPQWRLYTEARGLQLKIGQIDGRILSLRFGASYVSPSGWGVGVGYDFQNVRVRATSRSLDGEFEYRYQGPQVFVTYEF